MSVSTSTISNRSKIKMVFLGDQNTGKTSIIERYVNNTFYENPDVCIPLYLANGRSGFHGQEHQPQQPAL